MVYLYTYVSMYMDIKCMDDMYMIYTHMDFIERVIYTSVLKLSQPGSEAEHSPVDFSLPGPGHR